MEVGSPWAPLSLHTGYSCWPTVLTQGMEPRCSALLVPTRLRTACLTLLRLGRDRTLLSRVAGPQQAGSPQGHQANTTPKRSLRDIHRGVWFPNCSAWKESRRPTRAQARLPRHTEAGSLAWTHSSPFSTIRVVSSAYLRLLIFLLEILIPTCASSNLPFHIICSAYKLNKQGDNIQP